MKKAHAELDRLRQQAVAERVKARDIEAQLEAAEQAIERARDQVVEALASDGDVATARHAGEQAAAAAVTLGELNDAARLRVARAQAEADAFVRDRAPQLLDEQAVDVGRIVDHLNSAVGDVLQLHRALLGERQSMDRTISAAGGSPRSDGAAPVHEWEQALNELGRVVAQHPVLAPPAPRWHGKTASAARDHTHRMLQEQRA